MSDSPVSFRFRLKPVDDIAPWGPDPHLEYWGLTDGCYWIRVGDQELFRYTPEILAHWHAQAPDQPPQFGEPYDCYQVQQLESDLDVLAASLEPVPPRVARFVPHAIAMCREAGDTGRVPSDVIRQLATSDLSPEEEAYYAAFDWWRQRQMPVMHLRHSPDISIWTVGTRVTVQWDNREKIEEGIPVWTAQAGSVELEVAELIEAVKAFRREFYRQMRVRIDSICHSWSRPEVKIDPDALQREQVENEASVERTCSFIQSDTDWDSIANLLEAWFPS